MDRRTPQGPAMPMEGGAEAMPKDAQVVIQIMKSMGVETFEPRVVNQFLELSNRYIQQVLGDARSYSEHAGKPAMDVEDVRLAIQSRVNFSFTQPPPREILLELAKARNSIPLPPLPSEPGIPLPPESDCLIQPNYQISIPFNQSNVAEANQEEVEEENAEGVETMEEDELENLETEDDGHLLPDHSKIQFNISKKK